MPRYYIHNSKVEVVWEYGAIIATRWRRYLPKGDGSIVSIWSVTKNSPICKDCTIVEVLTDDGVIKWRNWGS